MTETAIKQVVIVGGGTAGWMTAALLSRAMGDSLQIRLIESNEIGTIGVGEATIPQIQHVNAFLGIDENDLLRATQGTFKLGVQFNDWGRIGDSYMHAFGDLGLPLGLIPFQHYWLRAVQGNAGAMSATWAGAASRSENAKAPDLWAYSLNAQASKARRFARMEKIGSSPLGGTRHAYHLDAGLYARYLSQHCDPAVVKRIEGKIVNVNLRGGDGFIESVQLQSGETIGGDLFIDCSGFRGILIEGALHTGYESWQHWLPCDRAVTVASARTDPMRPYTQATARASGWQWRIPLQHRSGNGHVFSSAFISDDEAAATLLKNLESEALTEPRTLHFNTGHRRQFWHRNCVAMGLAGGFMEPLESTGIHLIQSAISRLISLFPDRHFDPSLSEEYNRQTVFEYESIRDFLILHFNATERRDTPFWQHCAQISPPESLARKLNIFRSSGQIFREREELFTDVGWLQVMLGQGVNPMRHHPLADAMAPAQLEEFLGNIRTLIGRAVATMPEHSRYVTDQCAASR